MRKFSVLLLLFLLSSAFLLVTGAHAQFAQRGSISGTVFDPSNAVVPKAKLTLLNPAQSSTRETVSDATGHFEFDNLTAGEYQLTATAGGFSTAKSRLITVDLGQITHYAFHLQPGAVSQTVTVSSASTGLQTAQSGNTINISSRQIEQLPLNGLNFTSLAALAPGVSTYPQPNINPGGTYAVGSQFAMGGVAFTTGGLFQGSRDNGFYLNGVNIDDNYESSISFAPATESLGTAKVQVSDFSAAVGNDISSMQLQTKAGSSQFHGEAYDFMENTDLNATNPYNKLLQGITGTPAIRPTIIRNQFGGNLGGPIFIPKLFPTLRKRLFFFVNYQKMIEHDGNQIVATSVPSAAERKGDFSELLGSNPSPTQLYNPFFTTYDESGNSSRPIIPDNRLDLAKRPDGTPVIDPAAVKILDALWPLPNLQGKPSNEINFVTYQAPEINNYTLDTRFDAHVTPKDLVFITWSRTNGANLINGGMTPHNLYQIPVANHAFLVTANYAHVFTPNLTNELVFGYGNGVLRTISQNVMSWYNSDSNPLNSLFQNTGAGITHGLFAIYAGDYAVPGTGEVFQAGNKSLQFSDNVDWEHGKNSITAGLNYFRKTERDWDISQNASFGGFSSSGSDLGYIGGDAMADLEMGTPSDLWVRYVISGGGPTAPVYNTHFPSWGFYVNDRYRVTPKFTVSAGVRYNLSLPWYTSNPNIAPCCAIYSATPEGGVLKYPGIAQGLPEHYLSAYKDGIAPRLGLTYSLDQHTVVRAAYGIFYDTGSSQISNNVGNASYGTSSTVNYEMNNSTLGQPSDTPYMTLSDIFPAPQTTVLGSFPVPTGKGEGYDGDGQWASIIYYDQKSMPLPYLQRMMLDVQRQISQDDVISIGYSGAQGRRGWNEANLNLSPYQTGWIAGSGSVTNYDAARPNNSGRFGDIYVMRPDLNSFYNALILKWQHRFSNGLEFNSNYTWGKTVSDYPWINTLQNNGTIGSGGSGFQYPNVYNRGEANFSHRNRFVLSGIWAPQYGQTWQRAVRSLAVGWRLSGILTLESGDALTVTNGGPGTPCSTNISAEQCPTGFGSSAQDHAGFDEVNLSGNPGIGHFDKTPMRQFDTSKFSIPPMNVRGNSGLGTVRGPGQLNLDLSLAKTFPIYESLHVEFRGDAFNALNHTQWTGVNTTFPSGDPEFPFGMVNGAREARIGQVAVKLVF